MDFAPSAMSASPAATLRAPQKLLACFMSFLMAAHGLSCDYEDPRCNLDNPSQCGSDPDIGSCTHGYVLTVCGCCACGKGLGEMCGGKDDIEGVCGTGLQCVVNTDLSPDLVHLLGLQNPGVCSLATTPSATTQPPTPSVEPPSTDPTPTDPAPTDPTPTDCDSGDDSENDPDMSGSSSAAQDIPEGCRPKCSIDFCKGSKHRLCSAQELVYSRIQDRNGCQHTSCRACFLLVEPNCDIRCSEPPRKKCLKQYYECVKEHYLHAAARVLLPLDDSRAENAAGRIICHVPEVEEEPPH